MTLQERADRDKAMQQYEMFVNDPYRRGLVDRLCHYRMVAPVRIIVSDKGIEIEPQEPYKSHIEILEGQLKEYTESAYPETKILS